MLERLENAGWSPAAAAHLLNRAGFGGTPDDIAALHAHGLDAAVEVLLAGGSDDDLFPPPEGLAPRDLAALKKAASGASPEDRKKMQAEQARENRELMARLRAWWLGRMRWSPLAAREKATLFWHGHWATSIEKVKDPFAMWQQNETLRAYALGRFEPMAREISRDPAMMRYLDLQQSQTKKPNENFARELMELFTLGEGHYSEEDIQQAARAFTGYRIHPKTQQFLFARRQFDEGNKSFFGFEGPFSGDDIIGILAADPQCAKFLANKLWIYYAGSPPSPELLAELASRYRALGLDAGAFLREVFKSRAFYSPGVVRRQIKSPVQWIVQLCRQMEIPLPANSDQTLRQLGQVLFAPPNVKGWDGGRSWISSSTLLDRYNTARTILTRGKPDWQTLGSEPPANLCAALIWRLFQAPLPADLQQKFAGYLSGHGSEPAALRDLVHLMVSTPDYQIT